MNYYLFKLRFTSAVHFGPSDSALSLYTSADHFCADTLFSALCHTASELRGPLGIAQLVDYVQSGKLAFTDSMPWHRELYFLPKPYLHTENRAEIPAALRKQMKKLQWIDAGAFPDFAASVQGGEPFQPLQADFGLYSNQVRVNMSEEAPVPYLVGTYEFCSDSGLYFLAACGDEGIAGYLKDLVELLGISGIGGKTSSGLGRFSLLSAQPLAESSAPALQWLNRALQDTGAPRQLLLTASLPGDEELDAALEGANYQMIRRGGFAQSSDETYYKKRTQYFLAAGSVLRKRFQGMLHDVGGSDAHPVYRYAIPVFLGVTL